MHINQALDILELAHSTFDVMSAPNSNLAAKKLNDFKDLVKKQRKLLTKKYHPDLPDGNQEKMKLINNVVDELLKIQIQIQRPVQVVYTHVFYSNGNGNYSDSTSSTTSTTFGW
jgi:hypothetical protein